MGSLILFAFVHLAPAQPLGGCELWEEVVTDLEPKGVWACVQQHNALGSETALRNPLRVTLENGARVPVQHCAPDSGHSLPVWPAAKATTRITEHIVVDAENATLTLGDTVYRLKGADAKRLRSAADELASCTRCRHDGWRLPRHIVVAVHLPVKDDCDGLVRRVELFRLPRE